MGDRWNHMCTLVPTSLSMILTRPPQGLYNSRLLGLFMNALRERRLPFRQALGTTLECLRDDAPPPPHLPVPPLVGLNTRGQPRCLYTPSYRPPLLEPSIDSPTTYSVGMRVAQRLMPRTHSLAILGSNPGHRARLTTERSA